MKKVLKMRLLSLMIITSFLTSVSAQQLPNVTKSWFGNSNADSQTFMPQGIEDMFVASDGTIYTNVFWEEGGGQFTKITSSGVVSHGWGTHGWGHTGGFAIGANSTYVFLSQEYNEDGVIDINNFPPIGKTWWGISRRSVSDITTGPAFTGGKGGNNSPAGCFLPIHEEANTIDHSVIGITGIYASATEVFVCCPYDNKVRVYNASTMAFLRSWSVTNPCKIFMDANSKLWISIGKDATQIKRYDVNGILQSQEINLPSGGYVGDICVNNSGDLLISDVGQKERVMIYTTINTSPSLTSYFGTEYGIFSGTAGQTGHLKFCQIRGIGVDNSGNIIVGNTQEPTRGTGFICESYTSGGSLNWRKNCVEFVDGSALDESTGTDIYGVSEHFTVDFSKPAGQEATYSAFTTNIYKYPYDSRGLDESDFSSTYVRTINGKKILAVVSAGGWGLALYRFNASTDGEVAIPCVVFEKGTTDYPNSPDGWWMWRDLDGDGQMDSGEYTSTDAAKVPDLGYSSFIDSNGDIWFANGNINKLTCNGIDANGVPMYNRTYTTITKPAPFTNVRRIRYNPESDIMYLAGNTSKLSYYHWKAMGKTLCRYNNWSTGNRTSAWQITGTYNANSMCEPLSFDVAGDYAFIALVLEGTGIARGHIDVYNISNGSKVGYIEPPTNWGTGWMDIVECLSVSKRSNGEYVIIQEEDGCNKQLLYRWTPPEGGSWTLIDDAATGWTWDSFAKESCPTCYDGTLHSVNANNKSASYTFTGTDIEAYGELAKDAGSMEIFIDGISKGVYSQDALPYGSAQKFFSISGLTNSAHTIKLVSTSQKKIGIDYIRYSVDPAVTGVLTGTFGFKNTAVELSEGTADWIHFGNNDRKVTGTKPNSISNFQVIGSAASVYEDDLRKISWTDGTPTISSADNTTGIITSGIGNGFSFSVKAGNVADTLTVYVSGNGGGGTLTAHLSGNSVDDFVKTVANTRAGKWDGIFTIIYNAKKEGKTLDVNWVQATENGSIGMQAASISGKTFTSSENLSEKPSDIQVYPNPARNFVTIEFGNPATNTSQIELFDLLGNAVYKSSLSKVTKHEINTEKFTKGIYILKIVNGNEKFNTKLILE